MAPPILPRELVYLPLDELDPDDTFRLREVGDVSSLAQSIAQVGQLFPVEVRLLSGRYQLVTGFRRVAALKMLMRKRVLARVHTELSEQEAAILAAADAIDSRFLELEELRALEELYRRREWATPALQELISRAIEKAEERLEDLEAVLRGEPPPDRTIEDEDARPYEDEEPPPEPVPPPAPAPVPASAPAAIRPPPEAPPRPEPLGGPWDEDPAVTAEVLLERLEDLSRGLASLLGQRPPLSGALLQRLEREAASCQSLQEGLLRVLRARRALEQNP